ncbi:MAG: PilZ domain-containing protein [Nitrospirae bacterium]|nr:PilZ domain-containing protein [Nitrospirota bacterium]
MNNDKRRHKRVIDTIDAEIILGAMNYHGIVMNCSENGLYLVTATVSEAENITSRSKVKLRCHLPLKETVDLQCRVKWINRKCSSYGASFCMGMEIVKPPLKYKKYIETIQ